MAEMKKSAIKKHARSVILEQLNESSRTMDRIIGEFQENKRRMINQFGDLDKYDDLSTLDDDITDAVNCISTMMFNINAINSELDMLYHRLSDDWMKASTKKAMPIYDDHEIICPYCGGVARPSRDPAGAYVAYCNNCDRPLEEDELAFGDDIGLSTKKSVPDVKMSFTDNVNKMRVNNYAKTGNINTVMKENKR